MSWNFRVCKLIEKDTPYYGIHEVYYDENNDIVSISGKTLVISDDIEGLKWNLEKMLECCEKPIIDYNTGEEEVN